ncbi:methyltransferase domain-containing protein [Candidatus Aminicenantes bacterium AC-708-M15]|nr:methyltransferase domain-containing protein [SCandidatus Aminicenantes bacterium Aminicenantia_JdfR_composite]MCP2597246.1 methyltransferase domain-containing protein [Candidatus Aminicenantes bacterium AC-335-G13]MCP2604201.1 methyltransferase domain-containing protein [Candidatus Aminicenantes bacterium AC-708-M15]MCP2606562.1 methyltransferase domain-containing protein [Candidatus Aminicenantes bacterium AC-708-I09]MCP2618740.1 methyltransferase domain-containing protein [Candidatus Amini
MNKICQVADLENEEWQNVLKEIKCKIDKNDFHRKIWEYVQIIYCLKKLKSLTPQSICLAIGAGREPILYYLTYKVKKVYGIDLYEGIFFGREDEPDIPTSVGKYAPFPYREDKLCLMRMDALNLEFPDNFFDFIFSASSIEHFGNKRKILRAVKEMYRVLKPGGVAVITTELKLNMLATASPGVKLFKLEELLKITREAGFTIQDNFDLRIEEEYLRNWIKLPEEIYKRPHVILRFFNSIFTSINVVLLKEGNIAVRGEEIYYPIPDFIYKADIEIIPKKYFFKRGEKINLEIILRNKGNFEWINTGSSHRISLGVKLFNLNGELINRDFYTLLLPSKVKPGDTIKFHSSIPSPERGEWILKFDLKKELVFWFSEKGNPQKELRIKVI